MNRASCILLAVVSVCALSITSLGWACEACLEDKIAATYDWQIVAAAKRQGHTVVFSAIKGPITPGDNDLRGRLVRELSAIPGVDAGTVRVSLAPPAVSFATDLRRTPASDIVAKANHRLRGERLKLEIVRIGAPSGEAATRAVSRAEGR